MSKQVPQHLRALLNEIVEKQKIDLQLDTVLGEKNWLDEEKREFLIDALVYELSETGLRTDDEPNERGLQIEELIDFLNASRTKGDGGN